MESPTRLRPRGSMPHVASQWNSGQHQRGSYDARLSTGKARKSTEYLRPIAIPPSRPGRQPRQSPGMSFLATPETERWDFGSIRHIRQHSSETKTPVSAVDSVFELPSATSYNSPNSSTHSSFIAELEDTSPMALRTQKPSVQRSSTASPAVSHSSMEFKCAEMTSRAVIKVVDETIAAIEETNRKLLSRAVAAEEAANQLREQNLELESKIKHYSNNHRPKTAPSQPPNGTRPHHRPSPSSYSQPRTSQMSINHDPTPLSTFNAQIDKLLLPQPPKRDSRPREPPPYPPVHSHSHSSSTPISAPTYIDLAPTTGTPTGLSAPPKHHQRPPPLPLQPRTPSHSNSNCPASFRSYSQTNLTISGPIPGSVSRHEVTYGGTPLSSSQRAKNISLEEARRRAKPLPPLGPMSPSVLKGVVEIGGGKERDEWGRVVEKEEVKKRGFGGFFKWRREKENIF
ncbi:uncharacterized protein LY89DRAFT_723346 [Mollisia scopiformis]|uniref:Uncharacterized protein n=1 Tax=Mollisia scopiformis TaxID=149040 RepID=A0A194WS11_MOLSC|nr:uncharacterized protein LY89DRAFT_723346 [Mollisia scopiformis]KUJ10766.1 hypothetical protein LY89DRAFT_723346 [Mollisia scopiformis]